eukprot:27730-Pelagococcus_subviridis.AAC.3
MRACVRRNGYPRKAARAPAAATRNLASVSAATTSAHKPGLSGATTRTTAVFASTTSTLTDACSLPKLVVALGFEFGRGGGGKEVRRRRRRRREGT